MHVELYKQKMRFEVINDNFGNFIIVTAEHGIFDWDQAVEYLSLMNKVSKNFEVVEEIPF